MTLKEFIIPAVDIKEGKAVRLFKGNPNAVKVYGENPIDMAKIWEEKGAKRLHIVDLDGAFEGKPKNYKIVESIVKNLSIPIEFGGGLRSFEAVKHILEIGAEKVVIGSLAYQNQNEFEKIVSYFPNKVILGIDAKDGKVAIKGWLEKVQYTPLEFAKKFENYPIYGYLYTDVNRDGALVGPNVEGTKYLAENLTKPIVASGGVSNIEDVKKLFEISKVGIDGVVVGKALYEGKIKLEEIN
ncbi:MAG TPA: 1-(5-phosphoribosyl)-5-[(5-phosphoribosylamino)methylideneamino]imidazole-4-carboxamide isomerase [Hydrogenothermaceae bacterium]|nr:1-(5-phosphoribosyl)-5-[(5-phosphoribosylamino)methylideneamino]imidazole-4-carboxamide isomerase [Hydrogenothermaceae bacterium]